MGEPDDALSKPGETPADEQLPRAREALAARERLLAERTRRLQALEDVADRLSVARSQLQALSAEMAALRRVRRVEVAERDRRIAQLEALLAEKEHATRPRGAPDDLKKVKGIGPVIEALLHEMGITSFHQIAALEGEALRRVGDLLGVFRGRIRQDRWIEQARDLARRR